jgi:trigger factor
MGKKEGGTATLKTVLPPYFHKKEFQGKEASVKVTIKGIDRKVLPDTDNKEFLSAYGCESLDEIKNKIKERIQGEIERQQNAKYTQDIYTYFDENADFGLPPTVLKREIETRRNRMRHQLSQQDIKDEELKSKLGEAEGDIEKEAKKILKNFFILEKIAEDNTIVVTEEEIDKRIAMLAMQQRVTPADMKQHLSRMGGLESLRSDIREEKTIQFVIEKVDIKSKKLKKSTTKSKSKAKSTKSSASSKKKAVKKSKDSSSKSKAKTKAKDSGKTKAKKGTKEEK